MEKHRCRKVLGNFAAQRITISLEESGSDAEPFKISCSGKHQTEPVEKRHNEAIVERFAHRIFISTVKHCVRFSIKREAPANVNASATGIANERISIFIPAQYQ